MLPNFGWYDVNKYKVFGDTTGDGWSNGYSCANHYNWDHKDNKDHKDLKDGLIYDYEVDLLNGAPGGFEYTTSSWNPT